MHLQGIKNIILDLGGVLLNIDYSLTSKAFYRMGFRDFDQFYSQSKQSSLFDYLETGKISEEQFVVNIQKHLPRAIKKDIINAWNAMLLDFPNHRLELILKLKSNYNLFLLSNTNIIHFDAFKTRLSERFNEGMFSSCFKKMYFSHQIGLRKPDKECFQYVIEQNGLLPHETIFVDDSPQHIQGAKKLGIKAILLKKEVDIISLFSDTIQQGLPRKI